MMVGSFLFLVLEGPAPSAFGCWNPAGGAAEDADEGWLDDRVFLSI